MDRLELIGPVGSDHMSKLLGWWGKPARMTLEELATQQRRMLLGVNTGALADWASGLFADAALEARPRENGSPAMMFTELPAPHYRPGKYYFKWRPGTKAIIKGPIATVDSTSGEAVVEVTNPSDYGLSIAVEGPFSCFHEDDLGQHMLSTTLFRKAVEPFKVIRWMPALRTNYQSLPMASDPNTLAERAGIPFNFIDQISRETGTIPWVNIPFNATDDQIIEMAKRFRGRPMVYVEFSNEILFSHFGHGGNGYLELIRRAAAANEHPSVTYAKWAGRVLDLFKANCPAPVTRVLSAQHYVPAMARIALETNAESFDMVAPAGYMGPSILRQWTGNDTPRGLIAATRDEWWGNPETGLHKVRAHKELADEFGKRLGVYEMGHHFDFNPPHNWPPEARRLPFEAVELPEYRKLQYDMLKALDETGVEVACHYQLWSPARVERPQHGLWGLLRTYAQDPTTSPAYMGCVDYAKDA